jgi:hypothetical protein
MGACVLAEDTQEHRALYGGEGQNVLYFGDVPELILKTRLLIGDPGLRSDLRRRCHHLITSGAHRYVDRVSVLLQVLQES